MSPADDAAAALEAAVAAGVDALRPTTGLDWTQPTADLTWSVFQTAEHIGDCLVGYAGQVVGQPARYYVFPDITLDPDMSPEQAVAFIGAGGAILASVVRTTSPEARGYHPYGTSDPVGFAAMGIVEALVHTYDIRQTAGQPWPLPERPSAFAVDRLFPGAPDGAPAEVLLWCTGRAPLGSLPRQTTWRWDGTVRD